MSSYSDEKNPRDLEDIASIPTVTLNDGRKIPIVGFGTWKIPQDVCTAQVDTAIHVGFNHIDTAQSYANEVQAGQAIRDSGLDRDSIWVTTKWSGIDGKGPRQSLTESLEKLGLKYVDLLLIHHPRLCKGDIPAAWAEFETLQSEGLVKSIGVSNFEVDDLKVLLKSARVVPVVNQILFHPYVASKQIKIVDFGNEHGIRSEAYSGLTPLTSRPGGPVDKPVNAIAEAHKLAPEQVLLAWIIAKTLIPISTSSREDRLKRYLAVTSIKLTDKEIAAIDKAGQKGENQVWFGKAAQILGIVAFGGWLGYRMFV